MLSTSTEAQLRQLREGNRLKYQGVQWTVKDYSTYTDPKGYETEEWLLETRTGKAYYLMREVEPPSLDGIWYLAEELQNPSIYEPNSSQELTWMLADKMLVGEKPCPELQMFNRIYQFESRTEGTYRSEHGLQSRITWDYWDQAHLWNLALETWANGSLSVYSTRRVQPADFSEIELERSNNPRMMWTTSRSTTLNQMSAKDVKKIVAWIITIAGFFLMIFGI